MKIAIIGAGIAGLTAAREFIKRGANVTVFEKARGLGGRVSTKRLPWGTLDIGAQYFTARNKRFQRQVAQWVKQNNAKQWSFTPYKVTASGLCAKPDNIQRYVGVPGMNSIAHALAGDIDVCTNTRIDSITRCTNGWQLSSAESKITNDRYDWVVASMPAEQSRALLADTAIAQHIPETVHEPCWALALATRGNRHYWRFARVNNNSLESSVIIDHSTGVAAIGDWSMGGKVEGAYLSGVDLVRRLFA